MPILSIYQVDAFAGRPFAGNPAAVCPLSTPLPVALMQDIAAENNLSETAFFVPEGEVFGLRWFTPTVEASARHLRSGKLSRRRQPIWCTRYGGECLGVDVQLVLQRAWRETCQRAARGARRRLERFQRRRLSLLRPRSYLPQSPKRYHRVSLCPIGVSQRRSHWQVGAQGDAIRVLLLALRTTAWKRPTPTRARARRCRQGLETGVP